MSGTYHPRNDTVDGRGVAALEDVRGSPDPRASRRWVSIAALFGLVALVSACNQNEKGFGAEHERRSREMTGGSGGPGLGTMGPGAEGSGIMMGPGFGMIGTRRQGDAALTREEVEAYFITYLAQRTDGSYKVGGVHASKYNTFIVDIVTLEGAPVTSYEVDRHTGIMRPAR